MENLNKEEQGEVNLLLATQGYSYALYATDCDIEDFISRSDTKKLSVLVNLETGGTAVTRLSCDAAEEICDSYLSHAGYTFCKYQTPETATLLAAFK